MTVGDPLDAGTQIGPVASGAQYRSIQGYLDIAAGEGPSWWAGPAWRRTATAAGSSGRRSSAGWTTVPASPVRRSSGRCSRWSRSPTSRRRSAVANDSDYGLSGAVWAGDVDSAVAVARRLRTGQVSVNGGRFNVLAPFGGFKKSGVGRELGPHGLAEYFELVSLQLPADAPGTTVPTAP